LNFGESPEDAVVREVEEETGLRIRLGSVAKIYSFFNTSGSEDFQGISIIYYADIVSGELRHETSGTTDYCDWHELHPTPNIKLVDLAEVGVRIAQKTWPQPN
jgi:8-oxo-dGTP diphosphatase